MNNFEKQYYESPVWWAGNSLLDEANKKRIEETIKFIPSEVCSLADIGCGNGVFISALIDSKPSIITTGVDRSVEALKYVRGNKIDGDIRNLPFEKNSFDCVSCLEVVEHLNVNDFEIALAELSRISRKYIILGVPFDEKTHKNVVCCPSCKSTFNKDLHLHTFNKNRLDELFEKHGCRLAKFKNVVKFNELVGIRVYSRLLNLFRKPKIYFDSPICVICGYKDDLFDLNRNQSGFVGDKRSDSLFKGWFNKVKGFIKTWWPKRQVKGYWAICLYVKEDL